MTLLDGTKTGAPIEDPKHNLQSEIDETDRAIKEIKMMLEQSQVEISKLTQRNAAITAHLQQIQGQIGNTTSDEIRMAYDSALDAQQRLFVMRGQLEKLQSDQTHLERTKMVLERALVALDQGGAGSAAKGGKGANASIEMIINAQEAERQRLSRQMHDGPAQALSNFILQSEIAMRLMDIDVAKAREELSSLKISAMGTFQKVRNFIFELRPMMLDDLGLVPTIRRYADTFKEQTGLDVNVTITGAERRLQSYLEVMIFRALQELMGNAARHGQASLIKIQVDMGDGTIRASVDDNGKGFDPESIKREGSLGLKLIKERVEMVGGTFDVDSTLGKGSRISLTVPAHS